MRWLAVLLLVALPVLSGCVGVFGDDAIEPAAATAPSLPDGFVLAGEGPVERTDTTALLTWSGTTRPMSADMRVVVTTARPGGYASTVLELRATVPLALTFQLDGGEDANIRLIVADEYGREQCYTRTDACIVPWVRPTGDTRAWSVMVVGREETALEIPFTVDVSVETLAYDGPIDPRTVRGLAEVVPFEKPSVDGVVLRGHVYLPEGEGPFPTVLELTPYINFLNARSEEEAIETPDGRTTLPDRLGKFLENGYAVALVNLRGTGISDGCQSFFGPIDGKDAYHVIQGLAAQPWSNGNVGMSGISWYGYSQYAALRDQPPALKAVVPSSAILDQWTLWARYGPGITSQFGPLASSYAVFLAATTTGLVGETPPSHLACPELLEHAAAYTGLMLTGDDSPWLQERAMYEVIANSTVPMFVTNGLTNGEGHILQVEGLWTLMPEERRMMLGQWGHAFPDDEMTEVWDQMVLDFFAEHLKEEEPRLAYGVVDWQDTNGTWRQSDQWPPAATDVKLYLSDETLVTDPDTVTTSSQTFATPNTPDARTPWPSDCGDVAIYQSPPLAEDVLLAGNFFANLTVSSTLPNGNFATYLYHGLHAEACPDSAGNQEITEVRRAVSDLAHRGGTLRQGEPYPIVGSDVMEMRSYPFAEPVPAGHRLILVVAGHEPGVEPKALHPVLTVLTGTGLVGELTIPVVEGELRFEGDPKTHATASPILVR